jgi:RNA polymerase sigma-70 factor (ECF subfamily)
VIILQDDVLIQKILDGEQDAFHYMIETYSKLLWVVVGGILGATGTPQDIEECISDVYVHVWKNPKSYNPQKGSFKTFLAIIARNKALDAYRKLSKSKIIELNEAISASDDDLLDYIVEKEMHDKLYAAIETLTEPNKEIVIRRFFFGEKPRRIAEKIDIPIREVENRLYQSKLKLRKILEGGGILCSQKT